MCKIVRKTIKNDTKNSKTCEIVRNSKKKCEIVQKTIKNDTKNSEKITLQK